MSTSIPAGRPQTRILQDRIRPLVLAASALALGFSTPRTTAQDNGALIDALVREGILTQEKAENIRTDLQRDLATTSAGKIKLSNSVTELKLYGDLRLRYQYDERKAQLADTANVSQQSRWRYRLRLNADVALGRDWFAGVQLQTGQTADSSNQTYSGGFDNDAIFISKAYLGWKNDWLKIVAGKQANPFYTTDLVWDPDINPAGVTETIALHKLPFFGGGAAGPNGGYGKDGNSIAPALHSESPLELTLVTGQLFFQDNAESAFRTDFKTDAYLFVEQLIATYKFSKDVSVTIAPSFLTFTASHLTGLRNTLPFSDPNDGAVNAPATQTQTTVTSRERIIVNYNASGKPISGTATPFTITATQVQTTSNATVNGATSTTTAARTVGGDQVRFGAGRTLTAAELAAQPTGNPNGQLQRDTDGASVVTATKTNTILPAVTGETRQLHILTAPGDISFKLGGLKSKFYWDFAYNFGAEGRFNDIYQLQTGNPATDSPNPYSTRDGIAWLAGLQIGEIKKKGDWQAFVNYREVGIAAIDPNLNDSDLAGSALNIRGFKAALAYALADSVVLQATGFLYWNLDENLTGGRATGPGGIAPYNTYNAVQLDVNIKF